MRPSRSSTHLAVPAFPDRQGPGDIPARWGSREGFTLASVKAKFRVLVEQPTRGKRWVAVAADWPGLERGGKTEDLAVEKLVDYVPRYLPVAKRVRLGSQLTTQTKIDIIGRYPGTGSTDFWGISFAPSPLDREPFDAPTFDRQVRLLRAAWAEFDETAARVSEELRPGVRGGGRSRDKIIHHVLANEGEEFSRRVDAKSELADLLRPADSPSTATASLRRCVRGTRRASRSASGPFHTCSDTRLTMCSTTPGKCRIET